MIAFCLWLVCLTHADMYGVWGGVFLQSRHTLSRLLTSRTTWRPILKSLTIKCSGFWTITSTKKLFGQHKSLGPTDLQAPIKGSGQQHLLGWQRTGMCWRRWSGLNQCLHQFNIHLNNSLLTCVPNSQWIWAHIKLRENLFLGHPLSTLCDQLPSS
jgi:hypothetical protein